MNLSEATDKQKNLILNGLIILAAVFLAFIFYTKQANQLVLLTQRKETETKKNAVLKDIIQSEETFKSYKEVINNKDVSLAIDTFSDLAKASSVKIISLRPATEEDRGIYTRYSFELAIEAEDYHALGKFVSRLESHPYIYSVAVANIKTRTSQEANKAVIKLMAGLKINTILLKD